MGLSRYASTACGLSVTPSPGVVGSVQETVTVKGADPLLNGEDGSVGALVDRDQIERLPANGSGVLNLLDLAPGIVLTPATRGEAGQFTVGKPNADLLAEAGRACEPIGPHGGKPLPGVPLRQTPQHLGRERRAGRDQPHERLSGY